MEYAWHHHYLEMQIVMVTPPQGWLPPALCTYPYSHSTSLLNQKSLTPLSATSTLLSPSPSFLHTHIPQTHWAFPSYCSMIIHMAMRLEPATVWFECFRMMTSESCSFFAKIGESKPYQGKDPSLPPSYRELHGFKAKTGAKWERQKSKSRQHLAHSSKRFSPMSDGFILELFLFHSGRKH